MVVLCEAVEVVFHPNWLPRNYEDNPIICLLMVGAVELAAQVHF